MGVSYSLDFQSRTEYGVCHKDTREDWPSWNFWELTSLR